MGATAKRGLAVYDIGFKHIPKRVWRRNVRSRIGAHAWGKSPPRLTGRFALPCVPCGHRQALLTA